MVYLLSIGKLKILNTIIERISAQIHNNAGWSRYNGILPQNNQNKGHNTEHSKFCLICWNTSVSLNMTNM